MTDDRDGQVLSADFAIAEFKCPHAGGRYSFQLSQRALISGTQDGVCRMWDLQSERCVSVSPELGAPVTSLETSTSLVLAGSEKGHVLIWNPISGTSTRLTAHEDVVSAVLPVDDSATQVLTGSHDQSVTLWDVQTQTAVSRFSGHVAPVSCLAMSGDERTLLSGSWDRSIRRWDLRDPQTPGWVYMGETHSVLCMRVLDGVVFAGGGGAAVRAWDLAVPLQPRLTFLGHKGWVTSLAFTDHQLYSGGDDCCIRRWDLMTGRTSHVLRGAEHCIDHLREQDGVLFAAAGDGVVRAWDVKRVEQLAAEQMAVRMAELAARRALEEEAAAAAGKKGKKKGKKSAKSGKKAGKKKK